ncbi:MAG: dTMP kinase [Gammaproteobacteria bacterium]|uniref:dTMP kinase n=1 Tax=Nevskia sp. TaxID=1929292 RepID=UPI0040372590|nr:dTMP kinase [Gammaproteobacteria bacterium]
MTRGRFIVLEGGEGGGKSTQARRLRDHLEARGRRVLLTREPGGSPLAEAIRALVLGQWPEGVDATTELLLIFAARAAHLQATIRPALADGRDVICDRFVDASYAYQGAGRGVDPADIAALERLVLGDLQPDCVLLLDIAPEIGLQRIAERSGNNRFDAESMAFMQRVRAAYRARAAAAPARYRVIDAARDADTVAAELAAQVEVLP